MFHGRIHFTRSIGGHSHVRGVLMFDLTVNSGKHNASKLCKFNVAASPEIGTMKEIVS